MKDWRNYAVAFLLPFILDAALISIAYKFEQNGVHILPAFDGSGPLLLLPMIGSGFLFLMRRYGWRQWPIGFGYFVIVGPLLFLFTFGFSAWLTGGP